MEELVVHYAVTSCRDTELVNSCCVYSGLNLLVSPATIEHVSQLLQVKSEGKAIRQTHVHVQLHR